MPRVGYQVAGKSRAAFGAIPVLVQSHAAALPRTEGKLLMLWWFIVIWIASGAVVPMLWLLGLAGRGASAQSPRWRSAIMGRHAAPAMASTADPPHGVRAAAATLLAWLLSLTEERPGGARTARARVIGLYLLSGLVGVGVLILLFVAPLNDSGRMRRDLVSGPGAAAEVSAARTTIAEARLMQSPALSGAPAESATEPAAGETGCNATVVKSDFLRESPPSGYTAPVAAIQMAHGDAVVGASDPASRPVDDDAAASPAPVPMALVTPPVYHAPAAVEHGTVHHRARTVVLRPYATGTSRGTWLSVPNQNGGSNS
jgi:hypothetical protein